MRFRCLWLVPPDLTVVGDLNLVEALVPRFDAVSHNGRPSGVICEVGQNLQAAWASLLG